MFRKVKIVAFTSLVTLSSCGFQYEKITHETITPRYASQSIFNNRIDPYHELDSSNINQTACEYIKELNQEIPIGGLGQFRMLGYVKSLEERNRLVERFRTLLDKCENNRKNCLQVKSKLEQIENPQNIDALKKLNAPWGRVDIAANPLYQYFLTQVEVIGRNQFDKKLREKGNENFLSGVLVNIFKTLSALNIMDKDEKRFDIFMSYVNKLLPGSFDSRDSSFPLNFSAPDQIFEAGTTTIETLRVSHNDGIEDLKYKTDKMTELLELASTPLSLFKSKNWHDYMIDMRKSMQLAIKGFHSQDPAEEICATILSHRVFAQLLTLKGYARPATRINPATGSSYFGHITEMISDTKSKEGLKVKVCYAPGSFAENEKLRFLEEQDIAEFNPKKRIINLSNEIYAPKICKINNTVEQAINHHIDLSMVTDEIYIKGIAGADSMIDFLSGISQYVLAFNPAARWWTHSKAKRNFVLGPTDSQSISTGKVFDRNVILPYKSYALALGLMNMILQQLNEFHFVLIDEMKKETKDHARVIGLRIAQDSREPFTTNLVVTNVRQASLLAQFAFRFAHARAEIENWYQNQQRLIEREVDAEEKQQSREILLQMVREMFGVRDLNAFENFIMAKGSMATNLENLKLLSSMLIARFAVTDSEGNINCATKLINNLQLGVETMAGLCDKSESDYSDYAIWKDALKLAASTYHSPRLAYLSEEQ